MSIWKTVKNGIFFCQTADCVTNKGRCPVFQWLISFVICRFALIRSTLNFLRQSNFIRGRRKVKETVTNWIEIKINVFQRTLHILVSQKYLPNIFFLTQESSKCCIFTKYFTFSQVKMTVEVLCSEKNVIAVIMLKVYP